MSDDRRYYSRSEEHDGYSQPCADRNSVLAAGANWRLRLRRLGSKGSDAVTVSARRRYRGDRPEPQRAASGGVVVGGLRGATARSYAYATLRSVGSLHGCPSRSMPTGSPSDVNPAGILIAGNPVVALS